MKNSKSKDKSFDKAVDLRREIQKKPRLIKLYSPGLAFTKFYLLTELPVEDQGLKVLGESHSMIVKTWSNFDDRSNFVFKYSLVI